LGFWCCFTRNQVLIYFINAKCALMASSLAGKKALEAKIGKARVVLGAQTTGRSFIAG